MRYTLPMAMNLPITPALEELLREQMATGRFSTASDAVAAALRLLDDSLPAADAAPDHPFGLWKDRGHDGLAYQQELRAEWGA